MVMAGVFLCVDHNFLIAYEFSVDVHKMVRQFSFSNVSIKQIKAILYQL
jgi:hypothetical protein